MLLATRSLLRARGALSAPSRWAASSALPYRIRVPLAKLQAKKNMPQEAHREAALGDGEKLETGASAPDYLRLALTSRVYDLVSESPLQYASGLSHRLGASVHIKREVYLV